MAKRNTTAVYGWTKARAAEDYERWISAVPTRDRRAVRDFVDACGEKGRRDFWYCAHDMLVRPEGLQNVAQYMRRCAIASTAAQRSRRCGVCKRAAAVAINDASTQLCSNCISPGDELVVDTRPRPRRRAA